MSSILFTDLPLGQELQQALREADHVSPTPIQAAAIPVVLEGRDVLGCAQTGTGKTAAFALPLLEQFSRWNARTVSKSPLALVLVPTRELAAQVMESFRRYGKHLKLWSTAVYGGVNQNPQVIALRRGVHVLVATPGRLIDLMEQGHVRLDEVRTLILDEADRMLDMGFLPPLKQIISTLPEGRQSLCFSATMPREIAELVQTLLHNPHRIDIAPPSSTNAQVEQQVLQMDQSEKRDKLQEILTQGAAHRVLVFTRTKRRADIVAKQLKQADIAADAIHGDKTQNARLRALDKFKTGRTHVLVATDVAARGIDVTGISHVINYDVPQDPESYVHRIGRTGRASAVGHAITFCDPSERGLMRDIERLIGIEFLPREERRSGGSRSGGPRSGGARYGASRGEGSRYGNKRPGGSRPEGRSGSYGNRPKYPSQDRGEQQGEGQQSFSQETQGHGHEQAATPARREHSSADSQEQGQGYSSRREGYGDKRRPPAAGGYKKYEGRGRYQQEQGGRRREEGDQQGGDQQADSQSQQQEGNGYKGGYRSPRPGYAGKSGGGKPAGGKSYGRKTYGSRSEGSQGEGRKTYGSGTEGRKTYGSRSEGSQGEGRKTYGSRTEGRKTYGSRSEGSQGEGRKTYGSRTEGRKTYGSRTEGGQAEGRKTYGGKPPRSYRSSTTEGQGEGQGQGSVPQQGNGYGRRQEGYGATRRPYGGNGGKPRQSRPPYRQGAGDGESSQGQSSQGEGRYSGEQRPNKGRKFRAGGRPQGKSGNGRGRRPVVIPQGDERLRRKKEPAAESQS